MTGSEPTILFQRVRLQSGHSIDMALSPGVYAFVAEGHDALAEGALQEVCALLTGWSAPRRGRVRVLGQCPRSHPATRQRVASVLGVEPPLIGRTVGQHVERLDSVLKEGVLTLRDRHGWLEAWWNRPAQSLSASERRSLAAAVALAREQPLLAVLHEPTRLGPSFEQRAVLTRIRTWQEHGVTVVYTTTDPRVPARLGGHTWTLSRPPLSVPQQAEYLVRSSAARPLAARLADHPAVAALRYEEALPRDLWVRGHELDALIDAIQQAVLAEGCELYELTSLRRPMTGSPEVR